MRKLIKVINAQSTRDGDGVKINRFAGSHLQQVLNPFLMIDEIKSDDAADYIGGFPDHPHRGFETITYMKTGRMRHRDHMGNSGIIGSGDVQWMTAGAGVIHSEMPEQEQGLLHGFQIWLNLPATEKMKPASYREIHNTAIAKQLLPNGGAVHIIAGKVKINQYFQQGSLPEMATQPVFLDVQLLPNETVELSFNAGNTALAYVYKGAIDTMQQCQLGVYSIGSTLALKAEDTGAELLVFSGRPLKEPLVQYGPFAMNTIEDIEQAIKDFHDPAFINSLKANK